MQKSPRTAKPVLTVDEVEAIDRGKQVVPILATIQVGEVAYTPGFGRPVVSEVLRQVGLDLNLRENDTMKYEFRIGDMNYKVVIDRSDV